MFEPLRELFSRGRAVIGCFAQVLTS